MAGKDWGSGSALIAYAYAQHDAIAGADRDWFTQNHLDEGGSDFRSQSCTPGNITAGGVAYRMDTRTAGVNLCDENKVIDFYPWEERQSVYGALSQQLTEDLSFDITGYYSERDTVRRGQSPTDGTGIRGSGTITSANPYFRPIGAETSQTVAFNYSAVTGGGAGKSQQLHVCRSDADPDLSFRRGLAVARHGQLWPQHQYGSYPADQHHGPGRRLGGDHDSDRSQSV
jgi:iron complex outermembrane receptor protein